MNMDPAKGIGRALLAALSQFAELSGHGELASAKLILLGFSGTGSLVGRFAGYAPDRVMAVVATHPGHNPLGLETIDLSPKAAAIPQFILAGSTDRITGTERPYAYFRKYFDRGAPWTFVVQNKTPHCCVINAKALVLTWLDAVVVQRTTRGSDAERYGFIRLLRRRFRVARISSRLRSRSGVMGRRIRGAVRIGRSARLLSRRVQVRRGR